VTRREHHYTVELEWTGNTGTGTSAYRAYERSYLMSAPDQSKPRIAGSSDPAFRGDRTRWNPEELFVATLSACHQLWYLHLCADAGVVVTDYRDRAEGLMVEEDGRKARFQRVVLHPVVTLAPGGDLECARALHDVAHDRCYIANSVNFPVEHEADVRVANSGTP
jgi:organic hydroperoxide reductase OsmC/OhrA